MKRYLIQIPISLLKRGDRVYDFKKKKYDTVAYIERASENVHVAYRSIGDAPGEWKEYADNFKPQSTLWIFVDLSLKREQLIHMPAGYVKKGDMIFDPKSREVLEIDSVLPGNMNEVFVDVKSPEGVLVTIGLPRHVFLVKDLNEVPEDTNNYI